MKHNYLITVLGIQEVDGEKDSIEIITEGDLITKNGHTYISYKEYNDDDPKMYSTNLIKIEDDKKVTVIRKGEIESRLILEEGKRHQCYYKTLAGNLMIGIYTEIININLNEKGGKLNLKYYLDFNNDLVSNNELKIKVKEKVKE